MSVFRPLYLREGSALTWGNLYYDVLMNITDKYFQLDTIWVSCEGESPADIENIGPIDYYPERGFQGYFYPFLNSEGYLSPLVAVHFKRPRSKNLDIYVEYFY